MKRKPAKSQERTWGNTSILEVLRHELRRIQEDKRIPLLWGVELLLSVGLAASIAIYLDPDLNVVPFPWNVLAFLLMVGIGVGLHAQTRPYRLARRVMRKKNRE